MVRAAMYLRISRDATGERQGVTRQRQDCQKLADLRGWTVTHVVEENDTSATTGPRPKFDHLLELMRTGQVDAMIAWNVDRLARKGTDIERIIEIVSETGVVVATVSGDLNLDQDSGRMLTRIQGVVAQFETERKAARAKRANRQRAETGKPHGSRRPYGYNEDQMTLREDEAAVLRDMGNRIISGSSFKEVAWWLNENGIRTTEGRLWLPVTVRNMLLKPRYAGLREYEGEIVGPGLWEPVFDESTWEWLQATMRMRRENYSDRPKARKYLLTGLLFCGECGRPLNGVTKRDHPDRPIRRTYHCRTQGDTQREGGCGGVTRGAEPLEHFIKEAVIYRLDTPDLGKLLNGASGESLAPLLAKRQALTAKLDSLADDYADDTLTKAAYQRATARIEDSLARLNEQIDELSRSQLSVRLKAGESVREAWERHDDGWRRKLMSAVIDKVTVNKGITKPFYMVDGKRYRFDPSLVDVSWRA